MLGGGRVSGTIMHTAAMAFGCKPRVMGVGDPAIVVKRQTNHTCFALLNQRDSNPAHAPTSGGHHP